MGEFFNCLKRKRTKDSDSKTKSPEGKRVCNELRVTAVDDIRDDTITDNNQEAQALAVTNNVEDITQQLKLIRLNLKQ